MTVRSWMQWVAQPWRRASVALALIGSLALPALVLVSGAMFRTAASDEIASRVVSELADGPAGLVIQVRGPLDHERLDPFEAALTERLGRIDGLAPPETTLATDDVSVERIDGSPADAEIRLLARPDAADTVELLAGRRDGGALIPAALATAANLGPGSRLGVGDGELEVVGVYRDLWDGDLDPYWERLPDDLVPRWQRVFNDHDFDLVIVDEEPLRALGLGGRVQFEMPLVDRPATFAGLVRLDRGYGAVESELVGGQIGAAYRSWATDPEAPAIVASALPRTSDEASALIVKLDQPVQTTTWAGTVAGLLLSSLGAVFLIRRHQTEQRLLAADGDAAWRFFGRAVAQYVAPAVVGVGIGVLAGWLAVRFLGPSGTATWSVVPWRQVVGATALAVALAALVTARISVRLVDGVEHQVGTIDRTWTLVLIGLVVTMWVQIGRERGEEVNPLVVAFPLVGIATGVLVMVAVMGLVLRSLRRTGGRLPTALFLAWRALTASEAGALLLTATLGLASGLAVLSLSFVATIDAATNAKAATVVGASSRLDTIEDIDPAVLPVGSTVVRSQSVRVQGSRVEVLAIDPDTYADVVVWPTEFGSSPDEVLDLVGPDRIDASGALPVVLAGSRRLPTTGEFGNTRLFPYRIVGTVASAPMATPNAPTILLRADTFEALAESRSDADVGADVGSPLASFSDTALSRAPLDELEAVAERQGWRVVAADSLAGQQRAISADTTRWAFDFLGILSVIAGVVSLAVMAFYLAERRQQREVTTVMTQQMGIAPATNVLAAVVEMVGLVAAAMAAGALAAVVTARRVFPVFEPNPEVPPRVALAVDTTTIVALLAAAVVAVAVVAAWSQRGVSRVEKARVLRG